MMLPVVCSASLLANPFVASVDKALEHSLCYLPSLMADSVFVSSKGMLSSSMTLDNYFNIIKIAPQHVADFLHDNHLLQPIPYLVLIGPLHAPFTSPIPSLRHQSSPCSMMLELADWRASNKMPTLSIKRVMQAHELDHFCLVHCSDTSHESARKDFYNRLRNSFADARSIELYIGYWHDEPVTIGALFYAEGAAVLQTIATVPAWRGKGFAKQITEHLIKRAQEVGYARVVLLASPQGKPLYQSMGFVVYAEYAWYTMN